MRNASVLKCILDHRKARAGNTLVEVLTKQGRPACRALLRQPKCKEEWREGQR